MPKMRVFDDKVADFLRKPCYRSASKPRGTFLDLFWGISRKIAGFGVSKRQKECVHDLPSPAQTFEYADTGWEVEGHWHVQAKTPRLIWPPSLSHPGAG